MGIRISITDKRCRNDVPFAKMKAGDTFEFEHNFYLRTDGRDQAAIIASGTIKQFSPQNRVIPVRAAMTVDAPR